jgi:NhaA family Na+:H+ antiporter
MEKALNPIQRFFKSESISGILLIVATVAALAIANSPLAHGYHEFWDHTDLSFRFKNFELTKHMHHWVNDGLMAIFFFLIGLEIKRELLTGHLSSFKSSLLPIFAAVGGMLVPAAIYFSFNHSNELLVDGWAIPMATDIAFSLGILALLGKRVPLPLKVFLAALAIVDDIGAVLAIAIFYTSEINFVALLVAFGGLILLMALNIINARNIWFYIPVAVFLLWLPLLLSGVHATLAGVLAAFTIPIKRKTDMKRFIQSIQESLTEIQNDTEKESKYKLSHVRFNAIENINAQCAHVNSPLQKLEHSLQYFSIFIIMPIFAFANTGIELSGGNFFSAESATLPLGIILGLTLGKPIGITLLSFVAVKLKLADLPPGIDFYHIFGTGLIAGIGFTMSIFITELAFTAVEFTNTAKLSVLAGSVIAGAIGFFLLRAKLKPVHTTNF